MDLHRKALVFMNPSAGYQNSEQQEKLLGDALRQHQWEFQIVKLEREMTATSLAELLRGTAHQNVSRVFSSGGDGTVSLIANGIILSERVDLPLAIFPAGTANSLARELCIPTDWSDAASLLCSSDTTIEMDAMRLGERYYFLRIGIGLDAETIGQTPASEKRFLGRFAYLKSFLGRILNPHRHRFHCILDGKKRRFWAVQIFIANGGEISLLPFRVGPGIQVCDGELNVIAWDAFSFWGFFSVGWKLFRNDYKNHPLLKHWKIGKSVHIRSGKPVPVQGDGEAVTYTPIQVEVVPKRLKVIVPSIPKSE